MNKKHIWYLLLLVTFGLSIYAYIRDRNFLVFLCSIVAIISSLIFIYPKEFAEIILSFSTDSKVEPREIYITYIRLCSGIILFITLLILFYGTYLIQ